MPPAADNSTEHRGWLLNAVSHHKDLIRNSKHGLACKKIGDELSSRGLTGVQVYIDKNAKTPWDAEKGCVVQVRSFVYFVSALFDNSLGDDNDSTPSEASTRSSSRQPSELSSTRRSTSANASVPAPSPRDLAQRLQQKERALAAATASKDHKTRELAAAHTKLAQLQEQKAAAEHKAAAAELAEPGSAEHGDALAAARAQLAAVREEGTAAAEQAAAALADANARCAQQERALAAARTQLGQLEAAVEQKDRALGAAKVQVGQLGAAAEQKARALSAANARISTLEAAAEQKERSMADAAAECAGLRERVARQDKTVERLREELQRARDGAAAAAEQQGASDVVLGELARAWEAAEAARRELAAAQQEAAQLKAAAEHKDRALAKAAARAEQLLAALAERSSASSAAVAEAGSGAQQQQGQVESDAAVAQLRGDLAKLRTTLVEVTILLGDKGAQLRAAHSELASVRRAAAAGAAPVGVPCASAPPGVQLEVGRSSSSSGFGGNPLLSKPQQEWAPMSGGPCMQQGLPAFWGGIGGGASHAGTSG